MLDRLPGWESQSLVLSPNLPLAEAEGPGSTSVSAGVMALGCTQEGVATCMRSSFCEVTVQFMGEEWTPRGRGRDAMCGFGGLGPLARRGILLTYSFVADLPVAQ